MGKKIGLGFRALVMLIMYLALSGCATSPEFDEAAWRKKVEEARTRDLYAPHHRDGEYFNPWMPMEEKGFLHFLKWKFFLSREYSAEEKEFLPAFIPSAAERVKKAPEGDLLLWIGHATFLIRLDSQFWLTDPMLSDRALLPRRKTRPAMTTDELKGLGAPGLNVIISHNHYDHLDRETIEALPANTRFFVPMGIKEFITRLGKNDVVEMDWWQSVDAGGGTKVVCLPAQHWSRRIGQAANSTLWASFLIVSPGITLFYGGDSGYFIGFREIGRRYAGIDYALIPITAYHPRWFMHYAHMDIDESIEAFDDLGGRYFVPTQWGTFHLGDDPPGFPALDLKRRISARNLDPSRFLIMDIGQILPLSGKSE